MKRVDWNNDITSVTRFVADISLFVNEESGLKHFRLSVGFPDIINFSLRKWREWIETITFGGNKRIGKWISLFVNEESGLKLFFLGYQVHNQIISLFVNEESGLKLFSSENLSTDILNFSLRKWREWIETLLFWVMLVFHLISLFVNEESGLKQ